MFVDLKGKNALVTGSSQGIGKAIAKKLAECGANVIIHGISKSEQMLKTLDELKDYNVKYITKNLLDADAAKYIAEECERLTGGIDIFVSNASIQVEVPWDKTSKELFLDHMNANVWFMVDLMQHFVPRMKQNKWGRILAIGSLQQERPHHDMIAYGASKGALKSIVVNTGKILAKDNVLVNCLAPGLIDTQRNQDRLENQESRDEILATIPSGRAGTVDECAAMAALLCSDEASYMAGTSIFIDGGAML